VYVAPVIDVNDNIVGYNVYNRDDQLVQQRRIPDTFHCSEELEDDIFIHPYPDDFFYALDEMCKEIGATETRRFRMYS